MIENQDMTSAGPRLDHLDIGLEMGLGFQSPIT